MELVYLWVEDYKNIHKQGFNFSPQFHCEYDEEKNELTIDENKDYIPDIFGENINVTAIVGKNGSGKSNFLTCLSTTLEFTVFFEKNTLYIYSFFLVKIINRTKLDYITKKEKVGLKSLYMPTFDLDTLEVLDDIEKNKFYKDSNLFGLGELGGLILNGEYPVFQMENIKNQIIMFMYSRNNIKNIITPEYLLVNFDYYLFGDSIHIILDHFLFDEKRIERMSLNEYLSLGIYEYMYNILKKVKSYDINSFERLIHKFLDDNKDIDDSIQLLEKFENVLTDEIQRNIYLKVIEFFQLVNDFDLKYEKTNGSKIFGCQNCKKTYKVPLSDNLINIISKYIDLIVHEIGDVNLINFNWENKFSSGESSLLNQFALIYFELFRNKSLEYILIDEGENFLHPNWQKKYIDYLVTFLENNFPNRELNILLSSHSPFLLSDIPRQNIIFLDQDEKGNCKVVDGLKEKKETFGANIHTLLSDSFFMDDGLMGEFAKEKIQSVIDFLNDNQSEASKQENSNTVLDQQKAWSIIQLVGEPFLKYKLEEMYHEKFSTEEEKRIEKIKKLKEEIERLENVKSED